MILGRTMPYYIKKGCLEGPFTKIVCLEGPFTKSRFFKLQSVGQNFPLSSLKKSLEEVIAGSRGFLKVVKEKLK